LTLVANDLPLPAADPSTGTLLADDQSLVAGQAKKQDQTDSLMLLSQLSQRSADPAVASAPTGPVEGRQGGGGRSIKVTIGGPKSPVSGDTTVSEDSATGEPGAGKKSGPMSDVARAKADHSHNQSHAVAVDIRADKSLHAAPDNEVVTLLAQATLTSNSDATFRQSERNNAKPSSMRTGINSEGAWGPQALYSGSPLDVTPTTAADALVPPELMVAEQVNYWISQNVQNAELKLDGFDGLPVDVSITLQGNEARVDFRTDQEGIREILQNTESHLKDMLAKEGLVLSGVSVGTSNQEGRGASDQKEPENKRRAEVAVAAPVSGGRLRRSIETGGKSIDVFV
jgi:flagellar hook-length control protein FliK